MLSPLNSVSVAIMKKKNIQPISKSIPYPGTFIGVNMDQHRRPDGTLHAEDVPGLAEHLTAKMAWEAAMSPVAANPSEHEKKILKASQMRKNGQRLRGRLYCIQLDAEGAKPPWKGAPGSYADCYDDLGGDLDHPWQKKIRQEKWQVNHAFPDFVV
jgi:hypothetical protein